MAKVILVRHGQAASSWDADPDPGLSPAGRAQARVVAEELAADGPLDVITSPMRRCRETAGPLAEAWGVEPRVDRRVSEIATPVDHDLAERTAWLQAAMAGSWADVADTGRRWRDDVVAALTELERDAVVFTHFVAINAAVGAALGDDRLLVAWVDNCSRTVLDAAAGRLHLVELGSVADSEIR